jgi:hypothetical protein
MEGCRVYVKGDTSILVVHGITGKSVSSEPGPEVLILGRGGEGFSEASAEGAEGNGSQDYAK